MKPYNPSALSGANPHVHVKWNQIGPNSDSLMINLTDVLHVLTDAGASPYHDLSTVLAELKII